MGLSTSSNRSGNDKQPSEYVLSSSETQVISGFIKTNGLLSVSLSVQSITNIRASEATCGAANPTPGASYIVSIIDSANLLVSASTEGTGTHCFLSLGSGCKRMGNKDIIRIYVKVCLYSSNKHMLSMHTIQILNY